jgi:membrane protein implicated in regulation of membrane protease activity
VRDSRTVPRLRRRPRWFLTVAAALLAASPLAGCAAPSPQCAKADALRQAGHLTQAKAQYDRATAAAEAACADDGRLAVTRLRADLQDALARGRAAESAGNARSARDAYAAAARIDVDSREAQAALARVVGATAPSTGSAQVPASPVTAPVASGPLSAGTAPAVAAVAAPVGPISAAAAGISFWVAVAALVAVAAVVVTAAWVAAESRQRVEDLELQVLQLKGELQSAQERAREASAGVGRLEADTERLRSHVVATGAQIASERVRSDHILDVLGGLPPADVVVAEHYVPASDRHQTEGS